MERKEFTLPAKQLKAALCFVAKKGLRNYLQGVHIDPERNQIEATDGHSLFSATSMYPLQGLEEMIILVDGSIPSNADVARLHIVENAHQQLDCCEEPSGYIWFEDATGEPILKANGIKSSCLFRLISGDYPDVSQILAGLKRSPVSDISIDPRLMGNVAKACAALDVGSAVSLEFCGRNSAIRIQLKVSDLMPETTILVMPLLSEEDAPQSAAA